MAATATWEVVPLFRSGRPTPSGGHNPRVAAPIALEVEVDAARALLASEAPLLDVRDREERQRLRIAGSRWIPIEELDRRWRELPAGQVVVVHCAAGSRSFRATKFLREQGVLATSMIGGISEWMGRGLPTEAGVERATPEPASSSS